VPAVGPFLNVFAKLKGLRHPRPASLAALGAFVAGFSSVEAAIQASLWDDFSAYREAVEDGLVPRAEAIVIAAPNELWRHAKLIQIEAGPFKNPEELELGFDVDWDLDHTKGIGVARGGVTYANGSIQAWA
jgi:hypothetical protein